MVSIFTLNGTLWFYSAIGFIAVLVLYFILPETEGRTIEEVQSLFDNNNVNHSSRYDRKMNNEEARLKCEKSLIITIFNKRIIGIIGNT